MHTIKDLKVFLEYLATKYDEATIDEMQIVFKTELDPDEYVLQHPCPCETKIFITKDNEENPTTLIVFGEHQIDDEDDDETILHKHQLN